MPDKLMKTNSSHYKFLNKVVLCSCAIRITFILVFGFTVLSVFAGNGAEIIYKTDPEYQYFEFSSIAEGRNNSGNQHAITRNELRYRQQIDSSETKDGMTAGIGLALEPGISAYHNSYQQYRGNNAHYPLGMMYLYEKMPKAASLLLHAGLNNSFYAKMTYSFATTKNSFTGGSGILHPFSPDSYLAGDSPDEGYVSFSIDHLSIALGRFRGGIGHGLMGNLFQNSLAPYYDQLQASIYNRNVKYYFMVGFSSSELTNVEYPIQNGISSDFDYDKTWGKIANANNAADQADSSKIFAFHRVELYLVDRLTFGLGEMNLIGGKYPAMNLVNPLSFYHDTYDSNRSYYFSADVSWVPVKRHMVFVEVISNEIQLSSERSGDPTAVGFQGGYWYILPLQTKAKHRIAFEYTHLDTWTYSDRTPYLTMYQRQKRRETLFDVPLGYSQGGDCQHISLLYTAVSPGGWRISLTGTRLYKGEINFQADEEEGEMPYEDAHRYLWGPSGIVEKWTTAECSVRIPLTNRISIGSLGHFSHIENFRNEKGRTGYLMMLSLSTKFIF